MLGPQVEGYRAWLTGQGYTSGTIRNMLNDLGQLGRWLSAEGLVAGQLDEERIEAFRVALRVAGHHRVLGPRAMVPLLRFMRECGIAAAPQPVASPTEVLLEQYRTWMVNERDLAATTVLRYENTARRFLAEQATHGGVFVPEALTGADVNAFVLREGGRVCVGSTKGRVAELRSVLRFLYLQGVTSLQLGTAVPPVGGWRLAALPPAAMRTTDVQALLDGCDRGTDVGIRDYAIIMLVARLGLRSIEVARLELGDVDWRVGELVVRGKGRRQDRLPLPVEVGEALVAYLADGHEPEGARHLFLTCRAPRGPIRADLVGDVVERACIRVGLRAVGPHRLRHALAGELLRRGAGLVAISQVLRHQDLATTALYAKVDLGALRRVALPWPGAAR
ncbi:MAG: tyrosine-type recombinase/integrase [Intrasporangium sp.]|uniref:site-specific integrase n=1 Tax=Intrasporangium sp. TaxID=1925024 RepID=UPI0026498740|nr:site-specific integrase [Intrasporangium sp.]MDN5798347.1 tyrosine-type recombinase/integrase [Intrasporangium sp.]